MLNNKNIKCDHVSYSINIVNDYFGKEVVLKATNGKKAKIITATAMFYDFDDPNIAKWVWNDCSMEQKDHIRQWQKL